jgi:hypothetical protein
LLPPVGWVQVHPEITPPSNFHHLRDTTLCRRQNTLAVQIPYRHADEPLNLLVNSKGIKFLGDGALLSYNSPVPLDGDVTELWLPRIHIVNPCG